MRTCGSQPGDVCFILHRVNPSPVKLLTLGSRLPCFSSPQSVTSHPGCRNTCHCRPARSQGCVKRPVGGPRTLLPHGSSRVLCVAWWPCLAWKLSVFGAGGSRSCPYSVLGELGYTTEMRAHTHTHVQWVERSAVACCLCCTAVCHSSGSCLAKTNSGFSGTIGRWLDAVPCDLLPLKWLLALEEGTQVPVPAAEALGTLQRTVLRFPGIATSSRGCRGVGRKAQSLHRSYREPRSQHPRESHTNTGPAPQMGSRGRSRGRGRDAPGTACPIHTGQMWKPPRCPLTGDRASAGWIATGRSGYSTLTRTGIQTQAPAWLSLKDTVGSVRTVTVGPAP